MQIPALWKIRKISHGNSAYTATKDISRHNVKFLLSMNAMPEKIIRQNKSLTTAKTTKASMPEPNITRPTKAACDSNREGNQKTNIVNDRDILPVINFFSRSMSASCEIPFGWIFQQKEDLFGSRIFLPRLNPADIIN